MGMAYSSAAVLKNPDNGAYHDAPPPTTVRMPRSTIRTGRGHSAAAPLWDVRASTPRLWAVSGVWPHLVKQSRVEVLRGFPVSERIRKTVSCLICALSISWFLIRL
jgi:hypothetical protein